MEFEMAAYRPDDKEDPTTDFRIGSDDETTVVDPDRVISKVKKLDVRVGLMHLVLKNSGKGITKCDLARELKREFVRLQGVMRTLSQDEITKLGFECSVEEAADIGPCGHHVFIESFTLNSDRPANVKKDTDYIHMFCGS